MNDLATAPFAGGSTTTAKAASTLDHLSLLAVRGPDARTFLDSQLTRNVPAVPDAADGSSIASPAGYCSPKGRLLASLTMWADAGTVWLLLSRDIADAIARRLRMYVLRAKVTIDEVGATHRLDGFIDRAPVSGPPADLAVWGTARTADVTWLRFPDEGSQARWLRIAHGVGGDEGAAASDHWRWLDVRAGLPRITAATQDRFVPQMLNLEALGGVDFRKGCFPGQEIVARSQYLGKLKRRTTLASIDGAAVPPPGTDVWNPGDHEPCGLVVNAEAGPDGRTSLLVELPVTLFASTTLRLGTVDGPSLTVEALPYALPDNEVFVRPKL